MDNQGGWFAVHRTPQLEHMVQKDQNALALMMQAAMRARWNEGWNEHGLGVGQALVGDHENIGLTRAEYRSALSRLEKYGIATIKTTTKGTVLTLTGQTLTVCNDQRDSQQNNHRPTIAPPSPHHRPTTNEEVKKERSKEREDEEREEAARIAARIPSVEAFDRDSYPDGLNGDAQCLHAVARVYWPRQNIQAIELCLGQFRDSENNKLPDEVRRQAVVEFIPVLLSHAASDKAKEGFPIPRLAGYLRTAAANAKKALQSDEEELPEYLQCCCDDCRKEGVQKIEAYPGYWKWYCQPHYDETMKAKEESHAV